MLRALTHQESRWSSSPNNVAAEGRFREKKVAVLLDFVQMRGGGGPCLIFCRIFTSAFLVNFLQNANDLKFKLSLRLYT